VFDAGRSENGVRRVAFEAESQGQLAIKHGRAEFAGEESA